MKVKKDTIQVIFECAYFMNKRTQNIIGLKINFIQIILIALIAAGYPEISPVVGYAAIITGFDFMIHII